MVSSDPTPLTHSLLPACTGRRDFSYLKGTLPAQTAQITLIGTQEGSLMYQSSLLGHWYTGRSFPVPFWSGPREARLPRYPSACFADSSLGERTASSSRGFHQKRPSGIPDGLWSGKRDLNSRPRPWQGRALPTELFPRCECKGRHNFLFCKLFLKNLHFPTLRCPCRPLLHDVPEPPGQLLKLQPQTHR